MKHACGIDGEPGAVVPLDGRCAACDIGAQRVNDAVAANECHNRALLIDRDATICELRSRVNAAETLNEILTVEIEKLRAFAGKELI